MSNILHVKVTELAERVGRHPVLHALQRSLALTLPMIMIGALALLVLHPPFPGLKSALVSFFGSEFESVLNTLVMSSFGIAALVVLCGFAFVYTSLINEKTGNFFISPVLTVSVALTCFFITVAPTDEPALLAAISSQRGLPLALIVTIVASVVFLRLAQSPRLQVSARSIGHFGVVGDVIALMPAVTVTILLFAGLKGFLLFFGSTNVVSEFGQVLGKALASGDDSLWFGLIYVFLSQLFWLFGIHGPNVLHSVWEFQLLPAFVANQVAVESGTAPEFILNSEFFNLLNMGGSGATLGLLLAIFLFCKAAGLRHFAFLACIPALFNVNEPLIYGLPIVLNPIFALPFLLVPLLNTVIMYLAMSIDLVALPQHVTAWTTPPIINGYAITGSISGAVIQCVCLAVSVAAYAPFVAFHERVLRRRRETTLRVLTELSLEAEDQTVNKRLLSRFGEQRRLALCLAGDLEQAINQRSQIRMVYQPQMCMATGKVFGAEALMRWQHPIHGLIPPPVAVQLAEELGIMPELGDLVLELSLAQRKAWEGLVPDDFVVSVNVAPTQIRKGPLDDTVLGYLEKHEVPPHCLKLEITESTMLIPTDVTLLSLERLRANGVGISLDDFGMGHTSLRYLKALPVDEVKIDRSLTIAEHSDVNDHIIGSILDLSRSLGLSTIVEGIEDEDSLDRLRRIGCSRFQGYYFSRPTEPDELVAFVREVNKGAVAAA